MDERPAGREETGVAGSFEEQLNTALSRGTHAIVSRLPLDDLREKLRKTERYYLDLDGTLLEPGATLFDRFTTRMLRLIADHGGDITFLTGKPLDEIEALTAGMPEDLRGKISILYEKGAYRYTAADPDERFLTTESVENEMADVRHACFYDWAAEILHTHDVRLYPAGTGTHRSLISLDLLKPGSVIDTSEPDRRSSKITDSAVISEIVARLHTLVAGHPTLDLHVTDLGNSNIEIEVADIGKGAALARLEREKDEGEDGRALVMDDSGNGELLFRNARFLPHVTTALVYHDRTPGQLLPLADVAVAGRAKGAFLLEKAAQAKGITDNLTVVSNTPSLDRTRDNQFINRMGAPVAIGQVVRSMRGAMWIYPRQFSPDGSVDDFADYPDERMRGKFAPVGITSEEYDSHYNRISNTDWWFWAHPDTFKDVERQDPAHMRRYMDVCRRLADAVAASVPNGDTWHVSVHDFQPVAAAALFRAAYPERDNVRFHHVWHIPFPAKEQALRHRPEEIIRRLSWFMAYDQICFHTEEYKRNYLDLCAMFADRGIRPARSVIVQPISIDVDAIRNDAEEVARAVDFRFSKPELNNFFQLDTPVERREQVIMSPPERADPIKGGVDRLATLLEIAKMQPQLFEGRRFLEFILPTRLDSHAYRGNYEGMLRLQGDINRILGREAVFNADRLEDRKEVAAAMHFASKAVFSSRDDGFNMTIPETLAVWGASRLVDRKIRRMIATERTGFVLSLKEHGLLEPGKEAIPVCPSFARNQKAFRSAMMKLLQDQVPQPRYDVLEMYLARYTLQKWMDRNVREHVRSSFGRGMQRS